MKKSLIVGFKFLAVVLISFVWIKSLILDAKVKEIFVKNEVSQEELLAAINSWPNAKTTELIAVRISAADPDCLILDNFGKRIIEIDSRYAQGWHIDAICRNLKGDFTGAVNSINEAVKLDPLNPNYLILKVKLEISAGKKDSAFATLKEIEENYPDNPEITILNTSISAMP